MKIHTRPAPDGKIEWWYDRSIRSWVIRTVDPKGNQLGHADHAGDKISRDAFIHGRTGDE